MKIKEAINNFKNNTIYNSYYLKGNDQFLQNFFIQKSVDFIFKSNPYDKTLMNPGDMNEKQIIDQILITDLFKSKKLFILRDPQKLKSKIFEDLLKYLKNPHENHLLFIINNSPKIRCELEMTMLMWKNHFTCDILAQKGSVHIESLCKWGPSKLIVRKRILPSGIPTENQKVLIQPDPTWKTEYDFFKELVQKKKNVNLEWQKELNSILINLSEKIYV